MKEHETENNLSRRSSSTALRTIAINQFSWTDILVLLGYHVNSDARVCRLGLAWPMPQWNLIHVSLSCQTLRQVTILCSWHKNPSLLIQRSVSLNHSPTLNFKPNHKLHVAHAPLLTLITQPQNVMLPHECVASKRLWILTQTSQRPLSNLEALMKSLHLLRPGLKPQIRYSLGESV